MSGYHIKLRCLGLAESEGSPAPRDIIEGFSHRPWHKNIACSWDGTFLWLEAENDYDENGMALFDEFWDEVAANIHWKGPEINFEIVSVEKISD